MSRFIIDMEAQLVWHGSNCASFKNKDDLWNYLCKAKPIEARTVVKPITGHVETVEEALRRGVQVKHFKPSGKLDMKGMEPEDLLSKLGLL